MGEFQHLEQAKRRSSPITYSFAPENRPEKLAMEIYAGVVLPKHCAFSRLENGIYTVINK